MIVLLLAPLGIVSPRAPALYVAERIDARALDLVAPLTVVAHAEGDFRSPSGARAPTHVLPRDALRVRSGGPFATLILIERDADITTLDLLAPVAHFWGFHGGAYAARGARGVVAALNHPHDDTARSAFVAFTYVGRDGSRTHADTWAGFQRTWREDCERERLLLPGWSATIEGT
jgi:hypothetical protein